MPTPVSLVLGTQGIFNIVNGLYNLASEVARRDSAALLGIDSRPALDAIALGSLSIGTFYTIAAYQHNLPVIYATLPGRLLGTVIFWNHGGAWKNVAIFEAVCGVLTLGAVIAGRIWGSGREGGKGERKRE